MKLFKYSTDNTHEHVLIFGSEDYYKSVVCLNVLTLVFINFVGDLTNIERRGF